jgi:cytochrome P450
MGKVRHLDKIMFLSRDTRWADATTTIHSFIDKHIARAQKRTQEEKSHQASNRFILLDEMAKLTGDPLELRHQILHVFVPGHESTGVLLASTIYLLARYPEVWAKL